MIGYVNRKKLLATMKEEVDFNWKMQERYGILAMSLKDEDPAESCKHLDMQEEYINRWSESVRIYNMLKQMA